MTYFNARLVCQQNGGDLLVLKSQAENDNIVNQLQLINSSMVNGYWIGLTRMPWSWTGSGKFQISFVSAPTLSRTQLQKFNCMLQGTYEVYS